MELIGGDDDVDVAEGEGMTDVMFGDYKSTGKLSFSWPPSVAQIPIQEGDGKTPLFPFGFGFSH
jgi:beta-glucosidase